MDEMETEPMTKKLCLEVRKMPEKTMMVPSFKIRVPKKSTWKDRLQVNINGGKAISESTSSVLALDVNNKLKLGKSIRDLIKAVELLVN